MKRYLLFLCLFLLSSSFVAAQSQVSFSGTLSCPVFFDEGSNFGAQKSEMEDTKQLLKSAINDAYAKIHLSSDKLEKNELKDKIFSRKKQLMFLNYRLLILYKNQYLFSIID